MALIPIASLFVACKDKGYNLNNLQNDFNTIEIENENVKKDGNKLVFDWSNYADLETVVSTKYPYTTIKEYNEIYENIMDFAFEFIDECSNNSVEDKNVKNSVLSSLEDLKKSISRVDTKINMLAEVVNDTNDVNSKICLSRLNNLFIDYEELFASAINFNNKLGDLYFNHILINSNSNIASMDSANFDANIVINNFNARLKFQKVNLTACFIEMYFNGADLASKFAYAEDILDLSMYNYQENIDAISVDFDEQIAYEKATNSANEQSFYDLAVQAYNAQSALNNDINMFAEACNKIEYAGIDLSEASAEEKLCVEIIESRNEIVAIYNKILADIIAITIA